MLAEWLRCEGVYPPWQPPCGRKKTLRLEYAERGYVFEPRNRDLCYECGQLHYALVRHNAPWLEVRARRLIQVGGGFVLSDRIQGFTPAPVSALRAA